MHRFVMTVGGEPPPEVRAYLARADVDALSFRPDDHVDWRSCDGRVHVAGWQRGRAHGGRCHRPDGSFVAWAGHLRVAGAPGRPTGDAVAGALADDPHDRLREPFAAVAVDAAGSGIAVADELSHHPLFIARPAPGVTVLGDRAALVAEVDARWRGVRPARSLEAATWMAFAGYVVHDLSGFEHVAKVPQAAIVRIERGSATVVERPPVYAGPARDDRIDLDPFVDRLEAELVDALRHALELHPRPELELTGGKDSRLVLAVAHRAGLLDDFDVTTYGPGGLPDVVFARDLCEIVGVPHNHITSRKPDGAPTWSSLDRIRRHVHRTGGLSHIGDAVEPTRDGPVHVAGTFGEYYRVDHRGEALAPARSPDEALARFPEQRRFGTAGILDPDAAAACQATALDAVRAAADQVRDPADLRTAFTTRHRFPGWQNPLIDRTMDARFPFANGPLVRAAFRLPVEDRCLERPHRCLIERADVRLAEFPLVKARWRSARGWPRASISGRGPQGGRATGTRDEVASSVRATRDWLPVNRRDLSRLVADDPDNPLFDVVDQAALLDHICGAGPGDPLANMQVNGAIAAFLWLGAHELTSRSDG